MKKYFTAIKIWFYIRNKKQFTFEDVLENCTIMGYHKTSQGLEVLIKCGTMTRDDDSLVYYIK